MTTTEQQQITEFCSKCHQSPNAKYFAKNQWTHEVYKGFRFYEESNLKGDTIPPDPKRTIKYFADNAPTVLPAPEPIAFVDEVSPRFRVSSEIELASYPSPWVAHLGWKRLTKNDHENLIVVDMHRGSVSAWNPVTSEERRIAAIPHPAHVESCDLDNDGLPDMVAADLGSDDPRDHDRGAVVWLRQTTDGHFIPTTLIAGLGRVCETRVADFTSDGMPDILVAEFGWRRTGSIKLLERRVSNDDQLHFRTQVLDRRNGPTRVPPLDFDGDGQIDFVALIAQQHEAIDLFLNKGNGRFDRRPLYPPSDPAFGSNGLEAVDLDKDGDFDFVQTNGDMFDSFEIKPYHQLRWLENRNGPEFIAHHLVTLSGAHGVAIGDLDLDGDLDIVTGVCFPLRVVKELGQSQCEKMASAVWMEQTSPGEFVPHALEFGNPFHACSTLADIDDDGDLDVVLGMFGQDPATSKPPIVIFENLTRTKSHSSQ